MGGNTNFLICASRLGLRTASVGHLGGDVYGAYMHDVLAAEGVRQVEPVAAGRLTPEQDQTLLCFVLVDPQGQHAFCRWGWAGAGLGWWRKDEAARRRSYGIPQRGFKLAATARPPVPPLPLPSRYDFGPWPLLSFARRLPPGVTSLLQSTEALFVNGFVFDELPADAVLAAAATARAAGAAVFFDPGAWAGAGRAG